VAIDQHQPYPDVIVVGGGIVGCALAYDLTGYGLTVQLVERRELAREASWASAGIISPPVPALGARLNMGLIAYRRYPSLVDEVESMTGISTGFSLTGEIMAITDAETAEYRALEAWQQQRGVKTEWLDETHLRRREPALHERFAAGLLTPDTPSIRLDRFTVALAKAAELRGATLREFTTVTGVSHSGGRATGVQTLEGPLSGGAVVIAAGAWSGGLVESLDFTVPTHAVLGQMMAISNAPIRIRHVIAGGGGYIVPRADGTVAVGATEEPEAGFDGRVTPAGVRWLSELVDRVVPTLNHGTLESTWAGLRPASGDNELIVGRLPHLDNVWIATGHYRSGALLGPGTSQLLAASIVDGSNTEELAAFDPARFA
jgi:glycine oxidase